MSYLIDTQDIEAVVQNIASDCEKSFTKFHEAFAPKMYRVALYYTGCTEMAKEVVDDVFIKVWQKRERLPEINNMENYLFISTKNQSLNYINKYKKVRLSTIDDVAPQYFRENQCPETVFLKGEMSTKIESAVDQLPNRCRLIYKMVREEGLKHKQVADELGISVKTIEAQIGIAFKKLNGMLNGYYQA